MNLAEVLRATSLESREDGRKSGNRCGGGEGGGGWKSAKTHPTKKKGQ